MSPHPPQVTPEIQAALDRLRDAATNLVNVMVDACKLIEAQAQAAPPRWWEKPTPYKCRAADEARPITIYSSPDLDNPRPRPVAYEMTVTEWRGDMLKVYHSPPMWVRAGECRAP